MHEYNIVCMHIIYIVCMRLSPAFCIIFYYQNIDAEVSIQLINKRTTSRWQMQMPYNMPLQINLIWILNLIPLLVPIN